MDQRKYAFRSGIQIKLDANERRKLVYEIEIKSLIAFNVGQRTLWMSFFSPTCLMTSRGYWSEARLFPGWTVSTFRRHVGLTDTRGLDLTRVYIFICTPWENIYIYIYMKCNYLIEWHKLLQNRTVRGAPISFYFFLARRGNNSFAALQGHLKILIWDPKILAGLNKIYLIPPKAL